MSRSRRDDAAKEFFFAPMSRSELYKTLDGIGKEMQAVLAAHKQAIDSQGLLLSALMKKSGLTKEEIEAHAKELNDLINAAAGNSLPETGEAKVDGVLAS